MSKQHNELAVDLKKLLYTDERETDDFNRTDMNVRDDAIEASRMMPEYLRPIIWFYLESIKRRTIIHVNDGKLRPFEMSKTEIVISPSLTLESLKDLPKWNYYRTISSSDAPALQTILLAMARQHFNERGIEINIEIKDTFPLIGSNFLVHIFNINHQYKYKPCLVKNPQVKVKGEPLDFNALFFKSKDSDSVSPEELLKIIELKTTKPPLLLAGGKPPAPPAGIKSSTAPPPASSSSSSSSASSSSSSSRTGGEGGLTLPPVTQTSVSHSPPPPPPPASSPPSKTVDVTENNQ